MKFSYNIVSKVGSKRKNNEDAVGTFEVDDGLLSIVCDGLGGNKGGEIASNLSVDIIHETFRESKNEDYLNRIKEAVQRANEVILEHSSNDPNLNGMATTAEVLFLKNSSAYFGHVGDSRIYSLRNNRLLQLTKDHSLVQQLVDNGQLTLAEAESHPNRNVIVRALGDNNDIQVDISKMKLSPREDHKFLLCTDGVSGVIYNGDLEKILQGKDLNEISRRLISAVEENGAPDNFSFILLSKD